MAVLAPQDWHPPRDHPMDAPSPNSINSAVPRQHSSPANDAIPTSSPLQQQQQQPYPYPVHQQQAGWSPPHGPQQYYPAFYQNPHQPPYQLHGQQPHPAQGQMHSQNPYYDPANAQLAQWAYQQMMYNAQQAQQVHQLSHMPGQHPSQRGRAGAASPANEYFGAPNQIPGYSPFPSGTPPPHPSQLPNGYAPGPGDAQGHPSQYSGFHPYRRPNRQGSHNQEPPPGAPDWRAGGQLGTFQPPYARADAAGSSSSLNSGSTASGSSRQRTNSNQGSSGGAGPAGSHLGHGKPGSNSHSKGGSPASSSAAAQQPNAHRPHHRTGSTSSSGSAASRPSAAPSAVASSAVSTSHGATLRKPSPLSQGTFTAGEKRMSRDDSDLGAMLETIQNAPGVRSGGLKGRLRRALSLNANATLNEVDEEDDIVGGADVMNGRLRHSPMPSAGGSSQATMIDDGESTATVQKKKSRSLFNSRLNRSTDNISLSSTMSSASMVIRKLGSMAKLTRRNSLAGITSLFKDKKDKEDKEESKKKKKGQKGAAAEASVSHATAELDRSGDWTADMSGLSPAAMLARQHTLKTNAEAAARAKAEQEAKAKAAAAAAAAAQLQQPGDTAVPSTWEKNTTNRQGDGSSARLGVGRVGESGMRVVVEDEDSDSEDGQHLGAVGHQSYNTEGWDDDEDWGEGQEDEDATIRQGLERVSIDEEMEPWAINLRRSIERTQKPTKSILKKNADGTGYEQDAFLPLPNSSGTRTRSNSYDSAPSHVPELGPLARIPSPDPDHIDGLHRHGSHSSSHGQSGSSADTSFLPPLSFDSNGLALYPTKDRTESPNSHMTASEKSLFNHANSSAPALSAVFSPNHPPLAQRSATTPAKRLAFATNLSVYDTFPATVYDRRSEPATWSRLTPTLAQRIKEELNSYKMEEMEVHAASRVHTQFFV